MKTWPFKIIASLCILMPLAFSSLTFDHYAIPKFSVFLFGCSFLLVALIIYRRRLVNTPFLLTIALSFYCLAQLYQTLRLKAIGEGFLGSYGQSESLIVYFGFTVILLSGFLFIDPKHDLPQLRNALIVPAILTALYGIFQYFGEDSLTGSKLARITGLFGDPNSLGIYLVLILPVLFWDYETRKSLPGKLGTSVAISITVTALTLTFSRAAWLGFLGAMIIFTTGKFNKSKVSWHFWSLELIVLMVCLWLAFHGHPWLGMIGALFILFIAILIKPFNLNQCLPVIIAAVIFGLITGQLLTTALKQTHHDYNLETRFNTISKGNDSGRFLIWSIAWKTFLNSPLTGNGIGSFQDSFHLNKTKTAVLHWGPERDIRQVHNEPLHYLATQGVLGFLTYLALLAILLKSAGIKELFLEKTSTPQLALWSAMGAYLIFVQFAYALVHYSFFFWLFGGILIRMELNQKLSFKPAPKYRWYYLPGLIFILGCGLLAYKTISADYYYQKGFFEARLHRYPEAIAAHRQAIALNPWSYQYRVRYCLTLIRAFRDDRNRQTLIKEAKVALNNLARQYPRRYRPFYLLGLIAETENKLEIAVRNYQKALSLNPTNYIIWFNLARTEWTRGHKGAAITAFHAGSKLNPVYMHNKAVSEGLVSLLSQ